MGVGRTISGVLTVLSVTAVARATEIDVECPRLDAKGADEVRARAKLVLRSAEHSPRSLLVACDAERAWLVWDGPPLELLQVPEGESVVEATLDALDARLRKGPKQATPSEPASPKPEPRALPSPTPAETPTWGARTKPPPDPSRSVRTIGGLGVGLSSEVLLAPLSPTVGPRLDVGVGWSQFSLALAESARFGTVRDGERAFFYDLTAGVGFGAPYTTDLRVGAVLTSGVEWFNVANHTVTTGVANLGLRGYLPTGPMGIGLGVDGRLRFSPQYIGETVDARMPRFSVLFLLEGVLLVEPVGR